MSRFLLLLLLALPPAAGAIVIREDVDDAQYRVAAAEFPALVDLPGEGHGVLIDPQWVVTAAHAVAWQSEVGQVWIDGVAREVERVVLHPGYRSPPQALVDQALASGDAVLIVVLLGGSDDIALVRLAQPVRDVAPVALYAGSEEMGRMVKILGKGATGTGATGHDPKASHRTELRRAFNTITSAHERWACYVFDPPPSSLPLEGILGDGDSGGPVLIQAEGGWRLAGLASWKLVQGDIRSARPGRYGQTNCNVRLGHYRDWMRSVIAGEPR